MPFGVQFGAISTIMTYVGIVDTGASKFENLRLGDDEGSFGG